jgi:hypothetical protein
MCVRYVLIFFPGVEKLSFWCFGAPVVTSRGLVEYVYGLGLVDPGTYKDTLETCEVRI